MTEDGRDEPEGPSITFHKDRATWLEKRKQTLGGSEVSALFGVGYSTPLQLWMEKTGRAEIEGETPLRLRVGAALEEEVFGLARKRLEADVPRLCHLGVSQPHSATHPGLPDLAVTLDAAGGLPAAYGGGRMPLRPGETVPVELKTVSNFQAHEWQEQPHAHAAIQLAVAQLVLVAPVGYIVAMIGLGEDERLYRREPPPDSFRDALMEEVESFWQSVRTDTPPPAGGADHAALSLLYPRSTGRVILLPAGFGEVAECRANLRAKAKELTDEADRLDAEVKALMGDAEVAIPVGGTVAYRWQTVVQERKATEAKTVEFRKFTVGKPQRGEIERAEVPAEEAADG